MKTATTLIAHPTTTEQFAALKAIFKALKIDFEVKTNIEQSYDPEFVVKIKQGEKDFENGDFTVIETSDLWK